MGSLSLCSICRAPFRSVDLLGRKMSKKLGQPARLSSHETSLISPSLLSLGSPFRHFQSRGIYCSRLQPLIPNLRRTDREMGEGERGREGERERWSRYRNIKRPKRRCTSPKVILGQKFRTKVKRRQRWKILSSEREPLGNDLRCTEDFGY